MKSLIRRPWPCRVRSLTVAGVLALSLVPMLPASPAAAGERGARCEQAEQELKPIKDTVAAIFRIRQMQLFVDADFRAEQNAKILRSVRDLEKTLKASANQELLWRIRVLSDQVMRDKYAQWSLIKALDERTADLSRNIVQRREFSVTFVDELGQTVTKKTAC